MIEVLHMVSDIDRQHSDDCLKRLLGESGGALHKAILNVAEFVAIDNDDVLFRPGDLADSE